MKKNVIQQRLETKINKRVANSRVAQHTLFQFSKGSAHHVSETNNMPSVPSSNYYLSDGKLQLLSGISSKQFPATKVIVSHRQEKNIGHTGTIVSAWYT